MVSKTSKQKQQTAGEPTSREILDAVNSFATHVEKRFDGVEKRLEKIEVQLPFLVTKDYLDDKLADLKGDTVVLVRKEDQKVRYLAEILHSRDLLTDEDIKSIFSMHPFPDIALK